jgi:hypothetical protein
MKVEKLDEDRYSFSDPFGAKLEGASWRAFSRSLIVRKRT